jgi:hypothetical protein
LFCFCSCWWWWFGHYYINTNVPASPFLGPILTPCQPLPLFRCHENSPFRSLCKGLIPPRNVHMCLCVISEWPPPDTRLWSFRVFIG